VVLLDEPSMGLAPQIVEEVFEIVKDLNTKERVTFLLAEQNTNMALRYAPAQQPWSVALELNNVFDKNLRFQNTSLNDEPRIPLFQPGRSVFVRASLKL
jgi:ABC-type thiamine transport system ATPase subunit